MRTNKCRLAIFASGSGTNAEAIMDHFKDHPTVKIIKVYSNNADAFVLERAKKYHVLTQVITKNEFKDSSFKDSLVQEKYDLLVLAGFMLLVPEVIVKAFTNKIINIHPALLPKYGGKGMYGHFVHRKVIQNNESESGITIHYVNEEYDEGNVIFQAKCNVDKTDTADSLAEKIHVLEHRHYPSVIQKICVSFF
jgi:phosphoribosylglycinamide formyltransferase 1